MGGSPWLVEKACAGLRLNAPPFLKPTKDTTTMLIREKGYWRPQRGMSIQFAVDYACTPRPCDYNDQADRASKHSEKLAEILGKLMETLNASGALSNEAVIGILGAHDYEEDA
jgi:hypothetical protein